MWHVAVVECGNESMIEAHESSQTILYRLPFSFWWRAYILSCKKKCAATAVDDDYRPPHSDSDWLMIICNMYGDGDADADADAYMYVVSLSIHIESWFIGWSFRFHIFNSIKRQFIFVSRSLSLSPPPYPNSLFHFFRLVLVFRSVRRWRLCILWHLFSISLYAHRIHVHMRKNIRFRWPYTVWYGAPSLGIHCLIFTDFWLLFRFYWFGFLDFFLSWNQ